MKKVFFQSFPILILCGFLEMLAGFTLCNMENFLRSLPGLIIMVPAMMNLRGAINGALVSRLGSGVHMGVINFNERGEMRENLKAVLLLSVILPALIAAFAHIFCIAIGFESIGIPKLIFISVAVGLLSGAVLSLLSILITYLAFKRGIDPDNVTSPLLATFGDVLTISFLFLFAMVIA